MQKVTCSKCDGTGSMDDKICAFCGGKGYLEFNKSTRMIYVELEVPSSCQTCQFRDYDTCMIFEDKVFDRVPLAQCIEAEAQDELN